MPSSVLAQGPEGLSQAEGAAGCIANGGGTEGCTPGRGLAGPVDLAVTRDGRNVYTASSRGDAIAILARNRATGVLSQTPGRAGCISQGGTGARCIRGRALDEVWSVAVSPDGRNVYGVSAKVNMLGAMARDPSTGRLTQLPGRYGCFIRGHGGLFGCPEGRGLTVAVAVTVSRDGRNVYVASEDTYLGSVAVFRRIRRVRRLAVLVTVAAVLLPAGGGSAQDAGPGAAASGPNVVVVMTDDQRVDDMPGLPKTQRLIGQAGVTFSRYYASYPVCCPARATFFTGQYAQNHGVRCLYKECGGGYTALDQREYLPVWLERAGYVTAHVGKFLNGYGKDRDPDIPKGWTEWFGLVDPFTYRMWGYEIFENGDLHSYGSLLRELPRYYQTEVLTTKATQFIRRRARGDAPFFLSVAYLAPHHESGRTQGLTGKLVRPAPRDRGRYADRPLPKPPSYNEDIRDKPRWVLREPRHQRAA